MTYKLIRFVNGMTGNFSQFDRQTWLILFAVAVVVGFICLRGFGSRSSY